MKRYRFAGGTALVTGAASGIGAALSAALAVRGSHLVLLDRDQAGLAAVADAIRAGHPQLVVDTLVVDLADQDAVVAAGERLAAEFGRLTLVVNNAGVAMGGTFADLTLAEFDWLIQINFHAVVTLTHHLLPVLRSHRGSHLVNVSSVFGIVAPAGQSSYAASKFAVRGFTEALRQELTGQVGVTCVHPGGVASRIATSARLPAGLAHIDNAAAIDRANRWLTMPPEIAAARIVHAIERRKARLLIGWSARLPDILVRLFPGSYTTVLGRIMARATPDSTGP